MGAVCIIVARKWSGSERQSRLPDPKAKRVCNGTAFSRRYCALVYSETLAQIQRYIGMYSERNHFKKFSSQLLPFGLVAAFAVLVWKVNSPYRHSGPAKTTAIVDHLRQIEAAKDEWAIVNGATNPASWNRVLTPKELSPYLLPQFTQEDFGDPICGEVYSIQPLNKPPQARLTRNLRESSWPKNWTIPKGTIIKVFWTNGNQEYRVTDPGSEWADALNKASVHK